jgi:hypothetical protein
LGEHTRVGCNAGALFKREIEAIENDAMGHYDPGRCRM